MEARGGHVFGGPRRAMRRLPWLWSLLFLITYPGCDGGTAGAGSLEPIYEICDNGVPDVVVTLAGGTHCLLKGEHFYEINIGRQNASAAIKIAERWQQLAGFADLAFTISDVEWSTVSNKTIFVKGNRYFMYEDFNYILNGSTEHWFDTRKGVSPNEAFYDQVIHQKQDVVISFRHRKMLHLYETAMLFDDHRRPERVYVHRVATVLHSSVRSILDSSQAYYFVPSVGETFHLYFQSGDEGFFCFLPAFNSPCSPKKVTSMFSCPADLQAVRNKHFLGAVTNKYRITTHDFILCVLGAAVGIASIFFCLLVPIISKFNSIRQVQEDQLALLEEEE